MRQHEIEVIGKNGTEYSIIVRLDFTCPEESYDVTRICGDEGLVPVDDLFTVVDTNLWVYILERLAIQDLLDFDLPSDYE